VQSNSPSPSLDRKVERADASKRFRSMGKEPITPPTPNPAEPVPQPDPQPYKDPVKDPPFDPPDERPLIDPVPPNTDLPRM
jgi:hypothetical protein